MFANVHTPSRDQKIVEDSMRLFAQMQAQRWTLESHWDEIAQVIDPAARNTFNIYSINTPGEKRTDQQVDATGMMALERFQSILDSLLTPANSQWHGLQADDDYVMKDRATKLWFEDTTKKLFRYRYAPEANFRSQNLYSFHSLGAYGTGSLFIDKPYMGRGLCYRSNPVGEMFYTENYQGIIDGFVAIFRLTARQAAQREGWRERFPEQLKNALERGSEEKFLFMHRVCLRADDDYDPERLDARGKKFASYYISFAGPALMSEGGYHSLPSAVSRYKQAPQETYGRSPAMAVLPALKTLNAEKRVFLKAGHRAADPVLLTHDDGLMLDIRPGAKNSGGMNADGRPLVGTLPVGDIQISKEMMAEEKMLINDAFLVSLFQILTETPRMTATEVIERTNEKGILLAPTVGRQQSEYIGPMVHRELDLLSQQGLLLPMPPRLQEAQGSYSIVHTSPLSLMMKQQETAGFMRLIEGVMIPIANVTQDPSIFDVLDLDAALPEIAENQAVPTRWTASKEKIEARRKGRAEQAQKEQDIQAAPAAAALMKVQKEAPRQ